MRLYDYWRSGASYRVRIALALKHIPYEIVAVDLRKSEQRSSEYLAINPQGLVPALKVDGFLLTQALQFWNGLKKPIRRLVCCRIRRRIVPPFARCRHRLPAIFIPSII